MRHRELVGPRHPFAAMIIAGRGETSDTKPLRLVDTRIVGEGPALLTYQVVPTL